MEEGWGSAAAEGWGWEAEPGWGSAAAEGWGLAAELAEAGWAEAGWAEWCSPHRQIHSCTCRSMRRMVA